VQLVVTPTVAGRQVDVVAAPSRRVDTFSTPRAEVCENNFSGHLGLA
jgi:hypothetical protein